MINSLTWLVMLAVFSGLSVNLLLQFGLDLKGVAFDKGISNERLLAGSGVLFVAVILLWLVFSFTRSVFLLGLFEFTVLFPASFLVFAGLEYVTNRFILKMDTRWKEPLLYNKLTGGMLSSAALFVTLNNAGNLVEALVLSLGFSCSTLLVYVIVGEIRHRSGMESVPRWLRGGPLALVAMGLLSLVFTSGALMVFRVLGVE
jgi:Na+-translocating ferredoxin:NAD+ oxidoreductase RnfA subunit